MNFNYSFSCLKWQKKNVSKPTRVSSQLKSLSIGSWKCSREMQLKLKLAQIFLLIRWNSIFHVVPLSLVCVWSSHLRSHLAEQVLEITRENCCSVSSCSRVERGKALGICEIEIFQVHTKKVVDLWHRNLLSCRAEDKWQRTKWEMKINLN